MAVEKIKRKKAIIISVYAVLFTLLIFRVYSWLSPEATCFDGVKNQNEQEVDCGGICPKACEKIEVQALSVSRSGAVSSGIAGKYDFYAEVTNPNAIFGSKKFDYLIDFKDSSGQVIASRKGSSFILPGERKYVVENNIDSAHAAASFNFEISNPEWAEFNDYYEKPNIQIVNKNYNKISGGAGFSEAVGLLKNESTFDFEIIKIQVILKDNDGNIVALNSTQMKTVKSGEERDFKVFWPNSFSGTVGNMETQAEVNVFDSDTFLKRFYKTEKFQEY